ncbi:hypothetical protein BDR03DRAFT_951483, partial [Suillus americanus]
VPPRSQLSFNSSLPMICFDTQTQWAFKSSQSRVHWKFEMVRFICDIFMIVSQHVS